MSSIETKKVALEEEKVYIGDPVNEDEQEANNNLTKYKDEVDDYYKKKKTKKVVTIVAIVILLIVSCVIGLNILNKNYMLNNGKGEVDGEVFSFEHNNTFTLDGVEYTFPIKAKDLIDNGWNIIFNDSEDEVDTIEKYESVYVAFQKDGKEFDATLESFDGQEVSIEDADVYAMYINSNRTPEFVGPLDMKIGDDTDSSIKKIEDSGYAYSFDYYKSGSYRDYNFRLFDDSDYDFYYSYYLIFNDGELSSISIYYNE